MATQLFRQAALQELNVAERLDTAVRVVSPGTSLVVVAATILIASGVVWSLVGRVPSRVYGDGILLHDGSVVDVVSMADGQVEHVVVRVGDNVHENDVIAYIDQPELKKQQALLQAKLSELSKRYDDLASLAEKGRDLKDAVLARRRAAIAYAIRETRKQLALYERKLASDTALLDKGLTTAAAVAETRQKVLDLQESINTHYAEQQDVAFNALEATKQLEERKYELATTVSDVRRELEELQKRIDTQSTVLAKASGRVLELKMTDGDAVARGRPIATIEVTPGETVNLVAEVYVPAQDGKRVKPGMPIKLAPSVVKPEEDGYLEAKVESVSTYPVSEQSMLRAVRNESVVAALLKDGPVYEVRVRVEKDASAPSGLRWSSGHGPSVHIASGTPVRGLVTVRTRRPIELVLPALQRIVTDTPAGNGEVASAE